MVRNRAGVSFVQVLESQSKKKKTLSIQNVKCGRHFISDKDFKSSLYGRAKLLSDIEVYNKILEQEGKDHQL